MYYTLYLGLHIFRQIIFQSYDVDRSFKTCIVGLQMWIKFNKQYISGFVDM